MSEEDAVPALTREQMALERAALRFVMRHRKVRRLGDAKCYVASLWRVDMRYGKVTRESVRDSLIFELNARDLDMKDEKKRLKIIGLIDQWIEDHLELIGRAKFSGGDE